jgi:hypothetical protein
MVAGKASIVSESCMDAYMAFPGMGGYGCLGVHTLLASNVG